MRRRTVLIIASFAVVVVAITAWLVLNNREPRYKGKSLSYWLETFAHEDDQVSAQALRAIGTNAFPLLLRRIRSPEPKYRSKLRPFAEKLPERLRPKWTKGNYIPQPLVAAVAFRALRHEAAPLVPELEHLATARTTNVSGLALIALVHVGSNGVPALLAVTRDPDHPHRTQAVYWLSQINQLGPYTNVVIAELITKLEDPAVNSHAAWALGNMKARRDLIVPALLRCVQNTNGAADVRVGAIMSLGSFGGQAAPALPYFTNALNDRSSDVRQAAELAIKNITSAVNSRSTTRQ